MLRRTPYAISSLPLKLPSESKPTFELPESNEFVMLEGRDDGKLIGRGVPLAFKARQQLSRSLLPYNTP